MKYIYIFLLINWTLSVLAQQKVVLQGHVMALDGQGGHTSLSGATIQSFPSQKGIISDQEGRFSLEIIPGDKFLVVRYAGYKPDTAEIDFRHPMMHILLTKAFALDEVVIRTEKKDTYINALETRHTEIITEKELYKAACCNLSESFETNPSVDVAFTDAITGTREIQLLGLAGKYTQITTEIVPTIRGLGVNTGLNYIPGSWIESIQISKGTGSVVNGYESISGQINIELKEPFAVDELFINGYANNFSRTEMNLVHGAELSKNWAVATLLHWSVNPDEIDRNKDKFMDMPDTRLANAYQRWYYRDENGWQGQMGYNYVYEIAHGGQLGVDHNSVHDQPAPSQFASEVETDRIQVWGKLGYVFPEKPFQSVGLQVAGMYYDQSAFYGLTDYRGLQRNAYANLIYQTILGNTNHQLKMGLSYLFDDYDETFRLGRYYRTEKAPGAFAEYSYTYLTKFGMVAGLRVDGHNIWGTFITPRLHLRWAPDDHTTFRASLGRGQRTANIFIENSSVFVSTRSVEISPVIDGVAYGLRPEIAWNMGINVNRNFRLDYREGQISAEYYYTWFDEQVVVDRDASPQKVLFYNLNGGESSAKVLQVNASYEVIKRLDLRLAYRIQDVKTNYRSGLLEKPQLSKHVGFANVAYETKGDWKFDLTYQYNGDQRLPNTQSNPELLRKSDRSPAFSLLLGQISKTVDKKWELYLGGENLLDYRQKDPIISPENPFGTYFDASLAWGPIVGRIIYAGFRVKIAKE